MTNAYNNISKRLNENKKIKLKIIQNIKPTKGMSINMIPTWH